jgi:3,4-dihydroxy 2-butanone 4-phosphate synthase/GTP cyclohydrolase II
MTITTEAVRVPLPTPDGIFEVRAFERAGGHVYVAMVLGDIDDGEDVLVRLHSECLTGDALGSLRCDCGVQLRLALRVIAAQGRGVLIYATGHEGRGIGLVNKLRAYVAQDAGADTVDANVELGLPIDSRDYGEAAAVLAELGIRSIRLLTNNPRKVDGLRAAGTAVNSMAPLVTAPHHRNVGYLNTKARRLDHVRPTGAALFLDDPVQPDVDLSTLLGDVTPRPDRPFVVVKFAQTLDGRIATSNGDSKWISGMPERRLTHALRAACDAVMVGIGTVLSDDPQLTVRHVPGASPMRVVLDSRLRVPLDAQILRPDAATTIVTSERSDPARRAALRERGVKVDVVARVGRRLSLPETFARLLAAGTDSVLIEGGSRTITAVLAAGLVDRMIVSIAPTVIGTGTQAVDDLGTQRIADGIRLGNRVILPVGDDVVLAWDVTAP